MIRTTLRWLLLALVLAPLAWLAASWLRERTPELIDTWGHLRAHVLPNAAWQTFLLLLGVSFWVALLGGVSGWIQARFEYRGRKLVDVLLLAPLALPSYVVAFVFVGSRDSASVLSNLLGTRVPVVSGVAWAALVFGLCLYPYVYLLVRSSARNIGASLLESAQLFGTRHFFWTLILPLLRPAFVLGICLAAMETLADFGAASILGLDTLTTSVYKTWYSLFNLTAAAQLSSILVLAVLALIWIEAKARAKLRRGVQGELPRRAAGLHAGWIWLWYAPLIGLALIVPVLQLLSWAWQQRETFAASWQAIAPALVNSLIIASLAASLIASLGLMFVLSQTARARGRTFASQLFGLGYAVPGTVLAVAILLLLGELGSVGQYLLTGLSALLLAYLCRFARMACSPLDARLQQSSENLPEAARTLGLTPWRRFTLLYLPMLRTPFGLAWLLIFIEVLKELPATLVLRAVGWDTLAIRIYSYCSEGLWQQAALPALILVAAGTLTVAVVASAQRD
jgi:iron(III) transport system permease protein